MTHQQLDPLPGLIAAARELCDALLAKDLIETRATKDRYKSFITYDRAWTKAYKRVEAARVNLRKLLP